METSPACRFSCIQGPLDQLRVRIVKACQGRDQCTSVSILTLDINTICAVCLGGLSLTLLTSDIPKKKKSVVVHLNILEYIFLPSAGLKHGGKMLCSDPLVCFFTELLVTPLAQPLLLGHSAQWCSSFSEEAV